MIRSLRTRFFLIVWPLVVAATIGLGWYFGRWTRVEIRRSRQGGTVRLHFHSEEELIRLYELLMSKGGRS